MNNQFGNHAVVERRNAVAGVDFRINADTQPPGCVPFGNFTGAGNESFRVFGIDTAFNGVAVESDVILRVAEGGTAGNADLFADDIYAGNGFGNRMFYLKTGIHFHEIKAAVFIKKFQCSRVGIADFFNRFTDNFADFLPLLAV